MRTHGLDDEDIWVIDAISAFLGLGNRMANLSGTKPNEPFYPMGRVPNSKN